MANQRILGSMIYCVAAILLVVAAASEAAGQQQTADRKGRNYRWTSDKIQLDGPIPQDLPSEGTLVASEAELAAETKIRAALTKKSSVDVFDTPLTEVVAKLSEQAQVSMLIDRRALEAGGVSNDTPITMTAKDISIESLLKHMLRPLELEWVVKNEALLITTGDHTSEKLETRVYAVQDLVLVKRGDYYTREADDLLATIKEVIVPQSWADTGGTGAAKALGDSLVITQTREVHDQIANLLKTLRAARKLQAPTTETRKKVYEPRRPASGGGGSVY